MRINSSLFLQRHISRHEVEVDIEKCFIKSNWQEQMELTAIEAAKKALEQADDFSNVTLATGDEKRNLALNLTETRAPEWRNNKRVIIKENVDESEEIRRVFVKEELLKTVDKFMEEKCDKNGRLKEANFSKKEEKTLKSLKKRISDEELAVYESDKTGKLVVDTLENYEHKMKQHMHNDKVLTQKQVQKNSE